jgi:hypothetical protein
MSDEYIEDYEGDIDIEEAGYLEDADEEDTFEAEYERIFDGEDLQVNEDVQEFERDAITGKRSKQSRMAVLNKSKLSKKRA